MGTFDETAIVGYHLSFADKGKQTPVFCFCLKQTNGSLPFPFPFAENKRKLPFSISPVFRLRKHREMETWRNGNMETWRPRTWRHQMDNGAQAVFLNPFDVCSSCKRKLVFLSICRDENKRILYVCQRTKPTKRTWPSTLFDTAFSTYSREIELLFRRNLR